MCLTFVQETIAVKPQKWATSLQHTGQKKNKKEHKSFVILAVLWLHKLNIGQFVIEIN